MLEKTSRRAFKDGVFERLALVASAFGSPKRMELLELLAQGERPVDPLARQASLGVANASRHLQILKRSGLVVSRRDGLQVVYRLSSPAVLDAYRALRRVAETRLADVGSLAEGFFSEADGLEPVEKEDLLRRVRSRRVVVVDVRPREEFAAGHVAGALSIPLDELERRLGELPRGRRVVAYCRGPYCVLAAEAVRLLRRRGVDASRLKEGFPEWRDAGLPVKAGAAAPALRKESRR